MASPKRTFMPPSPSKKNGFVSSEPASHLVVQSNDIKYDERQNDEIEVLRSIFPEGFEDIETPKAWSRKAEKSFRLRLCAESDPETFVILTVTFTATYPRSLPLLSLGHESYLKEKTLEIVRHIIANKPKQLAGEVMILELSNDIRDALEDAVQARIAGAALPSLEEERATREAAAERVRKEAEQAEARRLLETKAEEERMMQQMMEGETKRREAAWKKRAVASDNDADDPQAQYDQRAIIFDQDIKVSQVLVGDESFRAVAPVRTLGKGPITEVLEVHSVQPRGTNVVSHPTCLVLKRASLVHSKAKKSILDLEDELERLKSLRHEGILNVLDFKISHHNDDWSFEVLTDFGGSSSVAEMLETVDVLPVHRARSFAIEALQALDFYHKNGIIHGRIHLNNLILSRSSTGNTTVKLADGGFQEKLHLVRVDSKPEGKDRARLVRQNSMFTAWQPPEYNSGEFQTKTRKSDIWDMGVVIAQVLLGADVPERYSSAQIFINSAGLSPPYQDMMRDFFRTDPRKRPNAFDVIPCEFLRTDASVLRQDTLEESRSVPGSRHRSFQRSVSHDDQANLSATASRFANEWDESGRLGKGGYGEVVKARNKLDGRIYAIKKITGKTPAQLSEVLSEVYLLATLNHPYVVRYYTAWPEDEAPSVSEPNSSTTSGLDNGTRSVTGDSVFEYGQSTTGGLDFISSSGYPKIQFGDDDDEDDDSDDDDDNELDDDSDATASDHNDDDDIFERVDHDSPVDGIGGGSGNGAPLSPKVSRPPARATLYIQMEFCERRTLRDTIRHGLYEDADEIWRFMRQILEGLVHIHGHGIIHRDLKPENIFIDNTNNPKIGDFGLATSGQYHTHTSDNPGKMISTGDMTRSIGTAMYVAPELRSTVTGNYTEKVDMYSLGIIFFEMCFPLPTAMERGHVLGALRQREHTLPQAFQVPEKQTQGDIIASLIRHKPSERPSSAELLRSGKLPIKIEDEQIRHALSSLSDPTSPYYHRMMSTLFSQGANRQLLDRLWDAGADSAASADAIDYALLQRLVKDRMVSVFRRYGAIETSRNGLIPRSDLYTRSDVFQLLDSSGTLVQLPYDLILPHARSLAKREHMAERSYTFGTVFRESPGGGAPRSNKEADFDIVSYESKDLALSEAEVIKCMDDMISSFPCFSKTPMCFHVSHSGLLDIILEFCRVPQAQVPAVKQVIGKLNIGHWTWQKIRTELRSPEISVASTSIDEMVQFDFRDTPDKAFTRLQSIFQGSGYLPQVQSILVHVSGLFEYTKRFNVRRKVWFSPLSSYNSQFYRDAIMFQCLFDTKKKDVLAAGGRYDSLIEDHRPRTSGTTNGFRRSIHAMGTNIAWDRLVSAMARYQKNAGSASTFLKKDEPSESPAVWTSRRCDVLVASFDASILRSIGVKLVAELRSYEIRAELAVDSRAPEQLLAHYKDDRHSWIIIIKHDPAVNEKPELKVRSMDRKGESSDIRSSELLSYLRAELRDRDAREGTDRAARVGRPSAGSGAGADDPDAARASRGEVRVLLPKSKGPRKTFKTRMVEAAQVRAKELLAGYADAPIASIETRDDVLERIRETRLSDPESWRRVVQDVPLAERQYLTQVHDQISEFKVQYGERWRKCFVYNFKTGTCIDYDLWL